MGRRYWQHPFSSIAHSTQRSCVLALLSRYIPIGMHPVLRAAREGNLEELKKLISEDSKGLQLTGIDNQRLIHIAAITGQLHVVRYLVEETKEDTNVVDDAGMTPLHWAAAEDRANILKYLVEECSPAADTSLRDGRMGWTAFRWAIEKDASNAIVFFVESRASDNGGDGGKEQKERAGLAKAVQKSDLQLMLRLFHGGARMHTEDGRPINTLLYVIQQGGSMELIRGLMKEHLVAHEEMLYAAVESGRADVVELLLESSSPDGQESFLLDLNAVNSTDGETPLTHAVKAGNLDMVKALIRFRADPSAVNSKGESAISLVSCDMEQQPHFRDFKHSFALRQLVLGEDVPADAVINKIYNHEPLVSESERAADAVGQAVEATAAGGEGLGKE